ncbi:MAG: hypothetical protein PHW63_09345 [Alphaproteobacteria bacterium]|nr:hypothetical protein [Alphaproteobacteria bacterium]
MGFSGGDKTWVVYQGPPRWDGSDWVNGDRFFLSGHKALQGREGVELAPGVGGLERGISDYRFDTSANVPGANRVDEIDGRREIPAAVNILGKTPREVRANKRKWQANHPSGEPGKLWFFSSDGPPRYLRAMKAQEAGAGTIEKEPANRNLYEKLEWGWTSDDAYFRGYHESKTLKPLEAGFYGRTFFNTSTVRAIYPVLYLPGGRWKISRGYRNGFFTTTDIAMNEEIRIDYDPTNSTYIKRNLDTGVITNMWPTMVGERPKLSLEAETKNAYSVELVSGDPAQFRSIPRLEFTPMFTSWV